jgi:hypothetical protein
MHINTPHPQHTHTLTPLPIPAGTYGNTALMKASYHGRFDVAKYLQLWGAAMEQVRAGRQ